MTPRAFDLGTPWVFWCGVGIAGAGLLIIQVALLADWFLRWRRGERDRRRCPRCWYDLHEAPLDRCPECGHVPASPSRMLRSRRRWGWAAAGFLVVLVGAGGIFNAQVDRVTWVPLAPSWLLVRMVDDPTPMVQVQGKPAGTPRELAIRAEVLRRYAAGELSLSQRRVLASRQFSGGKMPVLLRARRDGSGPILVTIEPRFRGPLPREFRAEPDSSPGTFLAAYDAGQPPGADWWQRAGQAHSGGEVSIGLPPPGAGPIAFRATLSESGATIWAGTMRLERSEVEKD